MRWVTLLLSVSVWLGGTTARAQSVELQLSVEVKRCLRNTATSESELRSQASCLSYRDESGVVESLRIAAKLSERESRSTAEWAARKAYDAEAKRRTKASQAIEELAQSGAGGDAALERVLLIALGELTKKRMDAGHAANSGGVSKPPRIVPPRACAERVNDVNAVVAGEALACVGHSNDAWPDRSLVEAATSHADAPVRHRALQLLRREPTLDEALTRQLAEYLVAQRRANRGFRDADDVCRILSRTTGTESRWASLAAAAWNARECQVLARRKLESPSPLPQFRASVAGGRGLCRNARIAERDYALLCAFDENHDPSGLTQGALLFKASELSDRGVSESSYLVPLLSGERLESKEVRPYWLRDRRPPGTPWVDVPIGLVVAPVTDRQRGTRRLIVYALRYAQKLDLVWQSPECVGNGCRLDIVQREDPKSHELTGLLLLSDERAVELDLKALLEGRLDAALGCPSLFGALAACRAFSTTAPR